ncbi:hypothetical protein HPB48_003746 [Haemaphysalis longicornis]|uniref:Uncharacterized protein n=1 Tax=Haemaphysalis longicornis TaxID=44386 RepID=A0A9J6FFT9_HAELO|nr:hypothetical protein HPB48_003746 [Haemaphysalis longicornis]
MRREAPEPVFFHYNQREKAPPWGQKEKGHSRTAGTAIWSLGDAGPNERSRAACNRTRLRPIKEAERTSRRQAMAAARTAHTEAGRARNSRRFGGAAADAPQRLLRNDKWPLLVLQQLRLAQATPKANLCAPWSRKRGRETDAPCLPPLPVSVSRTSLQEEPWRPRGAEGGGGAVGTQAAGFRQLSSAAGGAKTLFFSSDKTKFPQHERQDEKRLPYSAVKEPRAAGGRIERRSRSRVEGGHGSSGRSRLFQATGARRGEERKPGATGGVGRRVPYCGLSIMRRRPRIFLWWRGGVAPRKLPRWQSTAAKSKFPGRATRCHLRILEVRRNAHFRRAESPCHCPSKRLFA